MATPGPAIVNNTQWELSNYELYRRPHEMVADSSCIAVSPRALHNELMCPICLDLMKNTLTTKECLHRFCQECIITALRSGNKECPTCRKKLVSKRSLRPDPNFDSLIAKIYPNREELNAQQEKGSFRRAMPPIPRRKRKAADSPVPEGEDRASTPQSDSKRARMETEETPEPVMEQSMVVARSDKEDVELQLRPYPSDSNVTGHAMRNLATSSICTISHLAKYLSICPLLEKEKEANSGSAVRALNFDAEKKDLEVDKKFTFFMQLGGEDSPDFTALPSSTTLKQICDTYWVPGDKLKLYFALDEQLPSF